MQHSEDQQAEFKRQFASRRRNQLLLAIPVVAVTLLIVRSEGQNDVFGIPSAVILPAAIVVIVAGLAYSLYNWRCPACNKYLGKGISPKFCSECGTELT